MNYVAIMGRLTSDPEIRYTADNKPVANYTIAVDRRYKDKNGKYPTDFFRVVSFGNTADFVSKYLHKGTKVVAQGEIQNNNYEKDGKKVYQDQIIINNVEFAESKGAESKPEATDNTGFNPVDDSVNEDNLPFI